MSKNVILMLVLLVALFGGVNATLKAQTTLVSTGAVWKYLDTGADLGVDWRGLAYPDATWPAGPAPLGYGTGGLATTNSFGPDPDNKYVTTYYRHLFSVTNPSQYTNLCVRLLRDDGAVVFLNGTEIFRSNMPTNQISARDFSLQTALPGDAETNFYARRVNPALLLPDLNLLAVELHLDANDGGDIKFDLSLLANVPNEPPQVQILEPPDGLVLSSANLQISARASARYDALERVEFYANETLLGQKILPPYALTWQDVPRGNFQINAVAVSSRGLLTTSAPVRIVMPALMASNSVWKYFDERLPAPDWTALNFDDQEWNSGIGRLGFGGPVETMINRFNSTGDTNVAFYFRHVFQVSDPAAFANLIVRFLRDDGGVVYLNETEIFRSNMPEGPIAFDTLSAGRADPPQETTFYATNVPVSLLLPGANILAAEVHQCAWTSSDAYFDLELLVDVPLTPPEIAITSPEPMTTMAAPASFVIQAAASDYHSLVQWVDFYAGTNYLGRALEEPFRLVCSNFSSGLYNLCAVAMDASGLSATSPPVSVLVTSSLMEYTLVPPGDTWKYLDDGSNQGTNWVAPDFDDTGWLEGPAPFGTNQTDVTPSTFLRIAATNVTTYFRKQFSVSKALKYSNLKFEVLRDDGAVVYLNGAEVFRMNMPPGVVTNLTQAWQVMASTNETYYFPTNISGALLVDQTNLLAVELHQNVRGGTSIDAGFDLKLTALAPAEQGPITLKIERHTPGLQLTWTNPAAFLQWAADPRGPWSNVVDAAASPVIISTPSEPARFFRLLRP